MALAAASSSAVSVRQRSTAAASPLLQEDQQQQEKQQGADGGSPAPRSSLYQALTSTASLANLLPKGTVLAFQLLAPTFTNHGACDATAALLTRSLLAVLALSYLLTSFTDSLKGPDGRIYYGVATPRGLWLLDYPSGAPVPDTAKYRLAFIDAVYAVLSVAVFGVVAASMARRRRWRRRRCWTSCHSASACSAACSSWRSPPGGMASATWSPMAPVAAALAPEWIEISYKRIHKARQIFAFSK
ncbi:hypothetical protein ACQ4PT_032617 [Festuca glaucescens]